MAASQGRRSTPVHNTSVAGASGLVFVLLLLLGAGMASVPGADDTTAAVRSFYEAHTGVVVAAQVVELLATVPLVVFVLGLARSTLVARPGPLAVAGLAMASAAVLTVVPPLWLCVVAPSGSADLIDALALLSDLVDVMLFLTIAAFAGMCAREWLGPLWLRWAALGVAVLCALRAVEILFTGSALTVLGPVSFVLLVTALSVCLLRQRTHVHPRRRSSAPV
jgi:hypothetical protein